MPMWRSRFALALCVLLLCAPRSRAPPAGAAPEGPGDLGESPPKGPAKPRGTAAEGTAAGAAKPLGGAAEGAAAGASSGSAWTMEPPHAREPRPRVTPQIEYAPRTPARRPRSGAGSSSSGGPCTASCGATGLGESPPKGPRCGTPRWVYDRGFADGFDLAVAMKEREEELLLEQEEEEEEEEKEEEEEDDDDV